MGIETILSAAPQFFEKLIGLLKHRASEDRHYFDKFIEPIYQDLLRIHENYILSIKEFINLLEDNNLPLKVVRSRLNEKRIDLEHLRQIVCNSILKINNDGENIKILPCNNQSKLESANSNFVYWVNDYFISSIGLEKYRSSHFRALLFVIDRAIKDEKPSEKVVRTANMILERMPNKWKRVSEAYVQIKFICHKRI